MTVHPDELVKCRCGSSTFIIGDDTSLRTCSVCGYLTSFCKCKRGSVVRSTWATNIRISERTTGLLGAAIVSAMGTIFAMTFLSSPFLAIFGLGMPLALTTGFFVQWLRGEAPATVKATQIASTPTTSSSIGV